MGLFDKLRGSPEDRFARAVLERLRKVGVTGELAYDRQEFCIRDGRDRVFHLHNAFAEYQRAEPATREATLAAFVRAWLATGQEIPAEFDDARPDLLPVVRARSYFEVDLALAGVEPDKLNFPYAIIAEHLCVSLAYDLPGSFMQVNNEQLAKWDVTLYEALEVARQNLEERTEKFAQVGGGLVVGMHGDAYDASRLILTDLPARFELPGDAIAMVPNRETLVYAGADDDDALRAMLGIARDGLGHERHISGFALRLVDGEWEPWLPPDDHSLHHEFRLLRTESLMRDYANQKTLFERTYAARGEEAFIAKLMGTRHEQTGQVTTRCAWPRGLPALLPHADLVDFVTPREGGEAEVVFGVPWASVERIAGYLWEPLDVYPPRRQTAGFPTAEELAELKSTAE